MAVRLAFAVAAHLEPEILLVDEVLAVGDAEFQRRCLGRMEDLSQSGRTVVFVSHQMQAVAQLCDRAIWLDEGRIVREGGASEIVAEYLQSGFGSGSRKEWPDLGTAPGGDLVRLRSVRVVQGDEENGAVDVREPVGIEIRIRVLAPWRRGLSEDQGLRLAGERRVQRHGHERALARSVALPASTSRPRGSRGTTSTRGSRPSTSRSRRSVPRSCPHASGRSAVAFHVQDPAEGDSARGLFTGQWQGVVRPMLEWTTEES